MAQLDSGGVTIHYDGVGSGPPVVLVHGFAASRELNWKAPGWYDTLTGAGYRVAALDCRGHGESDKLYDPEAYGQEKMGGDVLALMDTLGIERAPLMGYSMGGMISLRLLLDHPNRFERVVLAGIGGGLLENRPQSAAVADGLEADDAESVTDPRARAFRAFAEQSKNDRRALAACMRRPRDPVDREALAGVGLPVLVVAGEQDTLVGDPAKLANAIPGAKSVVIAGRDHLTAVGDRRYKEAVLEFLGEGA